MRKIEVFWKSYKEKPWRPSIVTLLLFITPGLFLSVAFRVRNGGDTAGVQLLTMAGIIVPWLLGFLSVFAMFYVGLLHWKTGRKSAAYINLFSTFLFVLLFLVPLILFLIHPAGVGVK